MLKRAPTAGLVVATRCRNAIRRRLDNARLCDPVTLKGTLDHLTWQSAGDKNRAVCHPITKVPQPFNANLMIHPLPHARD